MYTLLVRSSEDIDWVWIVIPLGIILIIAIILASYAIKGDARNKNVLCFLFLKQLFRLESNYNYSK